ncbi:mCG144724, partial [Mus musculus]
EDLPPSRARGPASTAARCSIQPTPAALLLSRGDRPSSQASSWNLRESAQILVPFLPGHLRGLDTHAQGGMWPSTAAPPCRFWELNSGPLEEQQVS